VRSGAGGAAATLAGGRWSLVADLVATPVSATERAHAVATMLLERYGVVGRGAALGEEILGGYALVYPVLKEMEEAGIVRRGYFVEGLGGSQFAFPGAVERLRGERDKTVEGKEEGVSVEVLPAVDPANPWGNLLPWPERLREEGPRPRRVAGAWVALADGSPVFYLEPGGRGLVTFPGLGGEVPSGDAVDALREVLRRTRRRSLRLHRIDGLPAGESPHAPLLRSCGFVADFRGLRLER
jgi:ATP-dependent Lhr-like helicase